MLDTRGLDYEISLKVLWGGLQDLGCSEKSWMTITWIIFDEHPDYIYTAEKNTSGSWIFTFMDAHT